MDGDDIIMTDLSVDLNNMDYISFSDDDIRSPRTPTWAPDSPSSLIPPFDYTRFFGTSPKETPRNSIPPPPEKPQAWIWQCHLCRHRYALGVTRRCLYDGHYYCSGETDRPNLKKKRKGQACSSEFDYEGWGDYGDWKRSILSVQKNPRVLKACETCDFPSECRTPETQKPIRRKKSVVLPTVVAMAELRKDLKLQTAKLVDVSVAKVNDVGKDADLKDTVSEASDEDAAKRRQSKVQELVKVMHEGHARKTDKSEKRKSSKKPGLSVLEEEGAKKGVAQDLTDLLMPMVDIWNKKSGKTDANK